jgi:hypothetical protein
MQTPASNNNNAIEQPQIPIPKEVIDMAWMAPGRYTDVEFIEFNMLFASILEELGHPRAGEISQLRSERRALQEKIAKEQITNAQDPLYIQQSKIKCQVVQITVDIYLQESEWREKMLRRSKELSDQLIQLYKPHVQVFLT